MPDSLQGIWQIMDYCWYACWVTCVAIFEWPNCTTATKIWAFFTCYCFL
jgi:hypothetical protein